MWATAGSGRNSTQLLEAVGTGGKQAAPGGNSRHRGEAGGTWGKQSAPGGSRRHVGGKELKGTPFLASENKMSPINEGIKKNRAEGVSTVFFLYQKKDQDQRSIRDQLG